MGIIAIAPAHEEALNPVISEKLQFPVILCLYTGGMPRFASPMARIPSPVVGELFGRRFLDVLTSALICNQAVHDGAVMIGRGDKSNDYRTTGWSYRLHPPEIKSSVPNRGSAFNSCLAMSSVKGVDALYLISRGELYRFDKGCLAKMD